MEKLDGILEKTHQPLQRNVDIISNVFEKHVDTLNVNVSSKNEIEKIKAMGEDLANQLSDTKNLYYYLKCAREHQGNFLYECLAIVKEAQREGRITSTPAKYFVGVVKRKSNKS